MYQRSTHRSITTAALFSLLALGCRAATDELGPDTGPNGKADDSTSDASVPDPTVDSGVPQPPAGQDLDLEWSAWPTPPVAPPTSQYQVINGVVLDTLTGLEWQQVVPTTGTSWANVELYCDTLALDGGGWRLPTMIELLSIVDYTAYFPSINTDVFPNTPAQHFWTSTGRPTTASHRTVYFGWGYTGGGGPGDFAWIRCVRSPNNLVPSDFAGAPEDRYTIAATTVFDNVTGLRWQRNVSTTERSWADAADYCGSLQTAGGGWRLPTLKELQTLVDVRAGNPAIDEIAFPNTSWDYHVTSTPYAYDTTKPWLVSFSIGESYTGRAASTNRVRCVK